MARARLKTRWFEWAVLAVVLLGAVGVTSWQQVFTRLDLVIADQAARLTPHAASADIVLVAIDDKSLAAVGRWPWRRAFHAALLDTVTAGAPKAVGLDLILTEPAGGDDALLAASIARNGKVVLPLVLQDLRGTRRLERTEPVPALAAAAVSLGHIHLETDADGIVRSSFLREGTGGVWWDQFGVAVLRAGGFSLPAVLPGLRPAAPPATAKTAEMAAWQRDHWMQIPYAGPPGSFTRVSYVDVLKGLVPAGTFRDKYVLIGATSGGMGDAYATPMSGESELMAGVEINANVMNALLQGRQLARASPWQNLVFCAVPVALALLAVVLLAPTASLLASVALFVLTLGATWLAARHAGVLFAPSAALLGLLLAYPVWVWRRLHAATRYLLEELQRMEARGDLPPLLPAARAGDLLDRNITALQNASAQLRDLHRFVSDTLNGLPDATVIADRQGRVLTGNHVAQAYFGTLGVERLQGRPLTELLADVHRAGSTQPIVNAAQLRDESGMWAGEARDAQGRDLLVKCVPCFNTEGMATGWITSLVDISPIRQAERQRDQALRFISHDMRSPQSSILALLELHRMQAEQDAAAAPMTPETLGRIERHARRTLALAEEFVQLARAESSDYRLDIQDLAQLMDDAVDEVWAQAAARQVRITVERPEPPALCDADRSLMTRAITNLLGNAVKYSPEGGEVRCTVHETPAGWELGITDQGPGMTQAQQATLFRQFARLDPEADGAPGGIGLGLVFVRTVVERHGGHVAIDSEPGRGSRFHFTLARATE